MAQPKIVVVVPTLNEADNIEEFLARVFAAVPEATVVVVDDMSTDGTPELVKAISVIAPKVHLVSRGGKRGLGLALFAGYQWAERQGASLVVQMDGDLSHPPESIPALLSAAGPSTLVVGSRYVQDGGIEGWAVHRRVLSWGANRYARLVLGVPVSDMTSGFRVFGGELLQCLIEKPVKTVGYGFQIEMVWRAFRSGAPIVEVPFVFPDRIAGESKLNLAMCGEALVGPWRWRLSG